MTRRRPRGAPNSSGGQFTHKARADELELAPLTLAATSDDHSIEHLRRDITELAKDITDHSRTDMDTAAFDDAVTHWMDSISDLAEAGHYTEALWRLSKEVIAHYKTFVNVGKTEPSRTAMHRLDDIFSSSLEDECHRTGADGLGKIELEIDPFKAERDLQSATEAWRQTPNNDTLLHAGDKMIDVLTSYAELAEMGYLQQTVGRLIMVLDKDGQHIMEAARRQYPQRVTDLLNRLNDSTNEIVQQGIAHRESEAPEDEIRLLRDHFRGRAAR